jgi:hypothetical protein
VKKKVQWIRVAIFFLVQRTKAARNIRTDHQKIPKYTKWV